MENRLEYEKKLESRLCEWEDEIVLLKKKSQDAPAEGKIEYGRMIEMLENRQKTARMRLEKLKSADDNAWEDLIEDTEETWKALKAAFDNAYSKFL